MSEHLELFLPSSISYKEKFYIFMDLIVSNQSNSSFEMFIYFIIYFTQMISNFFSSKLGILKPDDSTSDNILFNIYKLSRFAYFFMDDKKNYENFLYVLCFFYILLIMYIFFVYKYTDRKSSFNEKYYVVNLLLKFFVYIIYNNTIDMFCLNLCFGFEKNEYINEYNCNIDNHIVPFFLSLFILLITLFFGIFIQIYNIDCFYLSTSYYSQLTTHYWTYMILNNVFQNILLRIIQKIRKGIFLIINIIISLCFLIFYKENVIYYEEITNTICGIFHLLYFYTSVFFLAFLHINIKEIGLIYIISFFLICFIFINLKKKFNHNLLCKIPFYQINNKNYLLLYLKLLINIINDRDLPKNKMLLSGIIKLHIIECPLENCSTKNNEKIYLPMTNEYSDRTKPYIYDTIFLHNLIIEIMNYFISQNFYNMEIIINFSIYYLRVIGNLSQSIYFYEKVKKMKGNLLEKFQLERLRILISKNLIEKLKKINEECSEIEDLNMTYYYKYEYYKKLFYKEIMKDLDNIEEFWKYFSKIENKKIDYNKIFKTTEKIIQSKKNIENLWNKLFNMYGGINEIFDFYCEYVSQINDDSFLKRKLEEYKQKNENFSDNININYNHLMFKSDVGIVIINGDKGKEGIIEKFNDEFCVLFKYNRKELKGMNINLLMPKIFGKNHKKYMSRYIINGEKKFINTNQVTLYGKDKENNIVVMKAIIKNFPILNNELLFIGMTFSEKIDDLILIDDEFIIQGMSEKLREKLKIKNNNFFYFNKIPFYMICKNFLNFCITFMKNDKNFNMKKNNDEDDDENESNNNKNIENQNIEINENIELEYEIKIPHYMMKYQEISMNFENNPNFLDKNSDILLSDSSSNSSKSNLIEDSDERDSLILSNTKYSKISPSNSYTPSGEIVPINNNNNPYIKSIKKGYTPVSPKNTKRNKDENLFLFKIKLFKKFFNNGYFDELEENLDDDCKDIENTIVYKFNFTFKKYIYGFNELAYIIRCIDNKNEFGDGQSEDDIINNENKTNLKSLITKLDDIKVEKEILESEKEKITENISQFFELIEKEKYFLNIVLEFKNEIKRFSRVHGEHKQNEIMDDENASQTSATGFNNDLSKINRILEIRANTLNNNSKFYTLKYIILIPLFLFISSIIFTFFFYIFYLKIDKNLKYIDKFNSNIYLLHIYLTHIISSILSMELQIDIKLFGFNFLFNGFINDQYEYFNFLKDKIYNYYFICLQLLGEIDKNLTKFIDDGFALFYYRLNNTSFMDLPYVDQDPFLINIKSTLFDSFYLNNLEEYSLNIEDYDMSNDLYIEILYNTYQIIEFNYNINLPYFKSILKSLLKNMINFNNKQNFFINLLIIIYLIIIVCLFIYYFYILIVTNRYMGEGIDKLIKISQDKLIELLENIRQFKIYSKSIIKGNNKSITQISLENLKVTKIEKGYTNVIENKFNNNVINVKPEVIDFSFDENNIIKLNLQYSCYIYLSCMFICDISICLGLYLIMKYILNTNLQILKIQTLFLGHYLMISTGILNVKCLIFDCNNDERLDYKTFYDSSYLEIFYQNLPKFSILDEYYSNSYLLDACLAMNYEKNTEIYNNCYENEIVKSLNNTNSFIEFIKNEITNIVYEIEKNYDDDYFIYHLSVSSSYKNLENAFYNYVSPTIPIFNEKILESIEKKLNSIKNYINIIFGIYIFILIFFILYVKLKFLPLFEYLLSVSKCVIKIIPTSIISSNQILENWLDKMNNKNSNFN